MPSRLLAFLVLLYPLVVFFGLHYFPPQWVGLALAGLFGLRLWVLRHSDLKRLWQTLQPAIWLAVACALIATVLNSAVGLRLIPVLINAACLIGFGYSLWRPPTMIERFARLSEPDLGPAAVRYTRYVTVVWCGFFLINGGIALYTALYSSLNVWTLYNGLIAYVLMGLLFVVEYGVRCQYKARFS